MAVSDVATPGPIAEEPLPDAAGERSWFDVAARAAPYVAAVLGALWIFRPIFDGDLFGNTGDARWTIAIHDHWYQVWRGEASIRDLSSFYPVSGTLGTSDPLLAQGQVYSLARFVGWGIVDAWVIAQFATFVFGTLGIAALSRRLLSSGWAQVAWVARTVLKSPFVAELLIVDDCSHERSGDLDRSLGDERVTVIEHDVNMGKGAALRTGSSAAVAPFVIVQDADLEYDPDEYGAMLALLFDGHAHVVFGSRFSGGAACRLLYLWHSLGNKLLTTPSNMKTNLNCDRHGDLLHGLQA